MRFPDSATWREEWQSQDTSTREVVKTLKTRLRFWGHCEWSNLSIIGRGGIDNHPVPISTPNCTFTVHLDQSSMVWQSLLINSILSRAAVTRSYWVGMSKDDPEIPCFLVQKCLINNFCGLHKLIRDLDYAKSLNPIQERASSMRCTLQRFKSNHIGGRHSAASYNAAPLKISSAVRVAESNYVTKRNVGTLDVVMMLMRHWQDMSNQTSSPNPR